MAKARKPRKPRRKESLPEFIDRHHGDKTNGRRGKFTVAWFARECGVSYPYMHGIVTGRHPASARIRAQVRALTDGQVSMDSF